MSDKDLDALIDSLAEAEREGYERALGRELLGAFDAEAKRRDKRDPVLEALQRAYQERQGPEGGQE